MKKRDETGQIIKNRLDHTFRNLEFYEDDHIYVFNGKVLNSATSSISEYVEPFDDSIAKHVAFSRGISEEEVLEEWKNKKDKAASEGTQVHLWAETYCMFKAGDIDVDFKQFNKDFCANATSKAVIRKAQQAKIFIDSIPDHYQFIQAELKLNNDKIGGTIDLLLYNELTGCLDLCDYKTNADLYKNYNGKKLLGKFDDLLDMPVNKYAIQLSIYANLLKESGFEVGDLYVVWLKEADYSVLKLQSLCERLCS